MTKIKYLNTIIIFALALSVSISCSQEGSGEEVVTKEKNKVAVKTVKLTAKSFTDYISVIGNVKPYQKALISTTEGGKIIKFIKDKGDYATRGDTILIINNEILEANLLAAKAQLDLGQITFEKQELYLRRV